MPSLRQQRLDAFRAHILSGMQESDDNLFRVLYGIPADVQIDLARHMTARFLPIFRIHHPQMTWPAQVLDELDQYFHTHGTALPDEPEQDHGGDRSFHYALYGLLDARSYVEQDNLANVTSACCTTLISAISARASNVWHADDPLAQTARDNHDRTSSASSNPRTNVASRAVRTREWLLVADWLNEREVGNYPDTEDAERETLLEWWKDRECLL